MLRLPTATLPGASAFALTPGRCPGPISGLDPFRFLFRLVLAVQGFRLGDRIFPCRVLFSDPGPVGLFYLPVAYCSPPFMVLLVIRLLLFGLANC